MKSASKWLLCFVVLSFAFPGAGLAQKKRPGIFTNPTEAGPDFQIQGEYEGKSSSGQKWAAQVVAGGDGNFDVNFLAGGLPGAGWDKKTRVKVLAKTQSGEAVASGSGWTAVIAKDRLKGKDPNGKTITMRKVERSSPTAEAKAPKGAVILFDGSSADGWQNGKIVEKNLLNCGTRSKKLVGTGKFHIEFRTPFRPKSRGQGRGNSGVYIMGREIQVLDSFGLDGKRNECGAFYGRAQPSVNMCLPPLSWQTYDVEIKSDGKKLVATVIHNGVKVHDDFPIGSLNTKARSINLQNHGNPVVYRNIWYVPSNTDDARN